MVKVSFTETYDLSTKTNKMTLIGVHTPTRGIFERLYPGFLMQYAKCRILSQDVQVACASMLPADPLQVGVTAGDIAPEDLFNPILYKAMTNDAWSTFEARVAGFTSINEAGLSTQGFTAEVSKDHSTTLSDEFGVYYSLLSDRRGWRVANPQAGLSMKKLRPLVFEKWYTHGVNGDAADADDSGHALTYMNKTAIPEGIYINGLVARGMRGSAHPMPSFNTTMVTATDSEAGISVSNPMAQESPDETATTAGYPVNAQAKMPSLPKVMTACIVVPPSRLHQLYYRMTVTTHVEFFEPRSMVDVTTFSHMNSFIDPAVYFSDYSFSSKLLTNETSSVDVSGDATVEKIMESDH